MRDVLYLLERAHVRDAIDILLDEGGVAQGSVGHGEQESNVAQWHVMHDNGFSREKRLGCMVAILPDYTQPTSLFFLAILVGTV